MDKNDKNFRRIFGLKDTDKIRSMRDVMGVKNVGWDEDDRHEPDDTIHSRFGNPRPSDKDKNDEYLDLDKDRKESDDDNGLLPNFNAKYGEMIKEITDKKDQE